MGLCRICNKTFEPQEMTKDGYYCRRCYLNKYHTGRSKKRKNEYEPPTYNNQLPNEPGVFYNDEQRDYTHDILRVIGWKHSPKGHWYDDKIRNVNGDWLVDIRSPHTKFRVKSVSKYTKWLSDNGMEIPKITYSSKDAYFTDEELRKVQDLYFGKRVSSVYVSEIMKCDEKEVKYVIHRTYKLIKALMQYEQKINNGSTKGSE